MLKLKSNPHKQAWYYVRKELLGTVCEVTRKKPWGFLEDDDNIHNYDIDGFITRNDFYDTIILHILSGEGEPKDNILNVLNEAYYRCIKLVILEHNPYYQEFKNFRKLDFIKDWIRSMSEKSIEINWGRNLLYSLTTMSPLHLPQINDCYLKKYLQFKYVSSVDYERANVWGVKPTDINGIDKNYQIYTHTSEKSIDFSLPKGTIYWVIGGGLAYETMSSMNKNILFDSTLLQVLYCARLYDVSLLKLKRLFQNIDIVGNDSLLYESQGSDPKHWRKIFRNEVLPDSIIHVKVEDLEVNNSTIYVSTIDKDKWNHLVNKNNIISSVDPRDCPRLTIKDSCLSHL